MRIGRLVCAAFAAAALFTTAACSSVTTGPPGSPSSILPGVPPLSTTSVDDKALAVAFHTFDAVLTAVDTLVDAKVIVPGSPTAMKIRTALMTTRDALNAASAAQRVVGAPDYPAALARADSAVTSLAALVGGLKR